MSDYGACCCEACGASYDWQVERKGDAERTWACSVHLHQVCVAMQRDWEITVLVVRARGAIERAEQLLRARRAAMPGAPGQVSAL